MKNFITYTLAATLVAGAAADHQHRHHHGRRSGSKVAKRDPAAVTEYVVAATETVYEVNGKEISAEEAEQGIQAGNYVVVGETNPSTYSIAAAPTSTSETESATYAAQFIESKAETTSTSTSSTPVVATTSSSAAASTTAAAEDDSSDDSNTSGGSGISSKFKSGTIKCSEFPSAYGAVALDWLEFGGWSGIQYVPDYTPGDSSITTINTAVSGNKCTENAFCSYACAAGYQKTQWPSAQGSTKESIGGLYCNSKGYLELTRDGYDTLCEAGEGGVTIKNDLDEGVAACRTDYPGTENMVVPTWAAPGSTVNICNPNQGTYYQWNGSGTSAQYYINKAGYSSGDCCLWTSPIDSDGAGNWAPIILGIGYSNGNTYISIFQNLPTSTAKLNFNIEIKGGNTKCSYIDGVWTGGSSGCTTTITSGGSAVVRYF